MNGVGTGGRGAGQVFFACGVGRRRRGVGMVEAAVGVGLTVMVGAGFIQMQNRQAEAARALAAAGTLAQVRAASHDWIRANYQHLVAALPPGGAPARIPVARTVAGSPVPPGVTLGGTTFQSLQGGGFLPTGLVDRNGYRQSHAFLVRQTAPGSIEGLVFQVGGRAVADTDLGRIVQRVGVNGGARFSNPTVPAMATMVQGNSGSWAQDSTVWVAGGVAPQPGRAAASASFGNAAMLSDFLNRYDIGIPEANTMRTALNMGNQDINNAGTARANQAVLQNGGTACAADATGCSFWISNEGRFSDLNDGWIRFQSSFAAGGLTVEGPDGGGNLFVQGLLNAASNARVGNNLTVVNSANIGLGGVTTSGNVNANQFWGNYLNASTGMETAGNLDVGGRATVTGNVNVFGRMSVDGDITTISSVFAGYMRSEGSIDAAGDVNALATNPLVMGRVYGQGGVQTGRRASIGTGCNGMDGMIAINSSDGGQLWCQQGTWRAVGAPFQNLVWEGDVASRYRAAILMPGDHTFGWQNTSFFNGGSSTMLLYVAQIEETERGSWLDVYMNGRLVSRSVDGGANSASPTAAHSATIIIPPGSSVFIVTRSSVSLTFYR